MITRKRKKKRISFANERDFEKKDQTVRIKKLIEVYGELFTMLVHCLCAGD
jgi:hypothetical protein